MMRLYGMKTAPFIVEKQDLPAVEAWPAFGLK